MPIDLQFVAAPLPPVVPSCPLLSRGLAVVTD
jgi:hypothetical protein